jgi:hypothetical protein
MSAVLNGSLPLPDAFSSYLAEAQAKVTELNTRTLILLLVNVPVLAIVLNVVRQLVSTRVNLSRELRSSLAVDPSQEGDRPARGLPLDPICWLCNLVRQRPPQVLL